MALQAKCIRRALCLFVFIILVRGFHELTIEYNKTINVIAGQSISLKCILENKENLTISMIDWTKEVNGHPELIVITNGRNISHGKNYTSFQFESKSIHSSKNRNGNLFIPNLKASDTGKYTCSFSTFPLGNAKVYMNLNVANEVDLQENAVEQLNVFEVMLNSIIQIPCGFNAGAKHNFTLEWLTKENGTEERLIYANRFENEINNITQYIDRISLGRNYSLRINSSMTVDERDFICRVETSYDSGFTIINKVNIFAEPKTPQINEVLDYTDLNNVHLTATCVSAEAFPKPNITWYLDGNPLRNGANGSNITSEISLDAKGLYKVKTKLLLLTEYDQWKNLWCEAMFSLPSNKMEAISSRKIQHQKDLGSIEFTPYDQYEVFAGSDLNVLCHSNSSATLQYKWTKDNRTVSSSDLLTMKNVTEETAGIYTCSVNIPGTNLSSHGNIVVTFKDNYTPPTKVTSETLFPAASSKGTESYTSSNFIIGIGPSSGTDSFTTFEPSNHTEATETIQPSPRIGLSVSTEASIGTASSTISDSLTINSTSITIQPLASNGPSININSSISNEPTITDQSNLITQTSTSRELISTVKLGSEEESEGTVSVAIVVSIIVILIMCTALAMYLIKRWQSRKMDGPPPFKPPPPPIKYSAIQGPTAYD
ncbi:T-cell surface protein tactile isoform X2 [Callorhinchus milii]|uniref:Ig-like domain-containing protein n=1 Tax=Callorhinchus milii TaxID=7868 RepID=A0A4W3JA92_CALMI|nr:T-cell surface protein tactile isoform X2 [Callorhinchus milii]|eukprot:gi/632983781/ref/XP_007908818.1/ PREDICTED: T-cell surface protein tactile isoform X2 [Callorhinchus milii]